MDWLLSLTGTEPTPFHNSFPKVAGLQIHDTTPGCERSRTCEKKNMSKRMKNSISSSRIFVKKQVKALNALSRIASYMDIPRRKMKNKSFITSKFRYFPIIWMLHSGDLYDKINSI